MRFLLKIERDPKRTGITRESHFGEGIREAEALNTQAEAKAQAIGAAPVRQGHFALAAVIISKPQSKIFSYNYFSAKRNMAEQDIGLVAKSFSEFLEARGIFFCVAGGQ